MDWLEEAGWSYDPKSQSIESVVHNSATPKLLILMMLSSPITLFPLFSGDFLSSFVASLVVFGLCYQLASLLTVNDNVRRISLSDLSQTVMKRNIRTLEHSKINILESKHEFTHQNLEVIVVEHEQFVGGGPGGGGMATSYQVRLVEKKLVGEERFFTCLEKNNDQGTLPHELRADIRGMEWNYRYDPAYDLQRILQSNIRDKAKAIEYGKRFRDFFIEGGWKELTRQPSPTFSNETAKDENRPFWE